MENTLVSRSEINNAMNRVYSNMGLAVLTSLVVSYLVSSSPALMAFLFTGFMKWIVIFAPLVAIFAISFVIDQLDRPSAQVVLHAFAALMGVSIATIFAAFKISSVANAFLGASVLFGVMSFYGYFTKTSLDSVGKFMFVGLVAVVIASIINIFLGSSVFSMVISALAIVVFLGLTAYDTQRIREEVSQNNNGVAEIRGALSLYMNFINIFMSLLNLFGERKE